MAQNPNLSSALQELDAGILMSKLTRAAADVALGVIQHNKKGKIVLTLDLDRIGESAQVNVSHKVSYTKPTIRGKATEEDTTTTPMHVNKNGHLSIAPDNQLDIFKLQQESTS